MTNFGKDGKSDYSIVKGRVNIAAPGTELFSLPLFDQRGSFTDTIEFKSSDNTKFTSIPTYSYRVIEDKAVDVVFSCQHISNDTKPEKFMESLEDNIIEPRVTDIITEESKKYSTEYLMDTSGLLKFELHIEEIIRDEFREKGIEIISFAPRTDFSQKVKERIETRNEVETNISVIEREILQQQKLNELERLRTEQNLIRSKGITPEILMEEFINKWDGKTPLYGSVPDLIKIQ